MSTYTNPYFSDHIDKSKINTIIEVGADNFIIKAENGVDIVDRVFENVLFVRKGLA